MKKKITIASIVLLAIAIFISARLIIGDSMDSQLDNVSNSNEIGERLLEINNSSRDEVSKIVKDLDSNNREDYEKYITEKVVYIIDNLDELENENIRMKIFSECNIIKYFAQSDEGEQYPTNKEKELRRDEIGIFAKFVFGYCLEINDNIQEKGEFIDITKMAESIEKNPEEKVKKFMDKILQVKEEGSYDGNFDDSTE